MINKRINVHYNPLGNVADALPFGRDYDVVVKADKTLFGEELNGRDLDVRKDLTLRVDGENIAQLNRTLRCFAENFGYDPENMEVVGYAPARVEDLVRDLSGNMAFEKEVERGTRYRKAA